MYYIGIDGGGTKTKYMLSDEKGKILASETLGSSYYHQIGFLGLQIITNEGINKVLEKANLKREDIKNVYVGCPGFDDVKADTEMLIEAINDALKNIPYCIGNDAENALAGALCGQEGINIVAGTGSIAFGYNEETNKTATCGGWHHALASDEGSGYWIAMELIHEFERQSDGRDEKTLLYSRVKELLNLKDDGDIISFLVDKWKLERDKIAGLAGVVNRLYDDIDPYAIKIVNKACDELFDIIYATYRKLEFNRPISVSYTGGVFKMGNKIINPLKDKLAKYNMKLVEPVLSPDAGALLLSLKAANIQITDEIINNLKENKYE